MEVTEPIRLRQWKALEGREQKGRLFTCGRPGRATYKRERRTVPDEIIVMWERGLPKAEVRHLVSLLGQKTDGFSEFDYYPFRSSTESSAKPTFQESLNNRYSQQFVVHEFPTVDARPIAKDVFDDVKRRVLKLLEQGQTVILIDSAGAERVARVCESIGYHGTS
jgi:hypothetical protein